MACSIGEVDCECGGGAYCGGLGSHEEFVWFPQLGLKALSNGALVGETLHRGALIHWFL